MAARLKNACGSPRPGRTTRQRPQDLDDGRTRQALAFHYLAPEFAVCPSSTSVRGLQHHQYAYETSERDRVPKYEAQYRAFVTNQLAPVEATTIDWASIILPITPLEELAALIKPARYPIARRHGLLQISEKHVGGR